MRRPTDGRTAIGLASAIGFASGRIRVCIAAGLVALAALTIAGPATGATFAKPAEPAAPTATPPQIHELLYLLADPKVQAWLAQQHPAAATPVAPHKREAPADFMSGRVAAVRSHLVAMTAAAPGLPGQFAHAAEMFRGGMEGRRPGRILLLLGGFVALGFGVEALFRRATWRIRRHLDQHPVETTGERARLVAERAAFAIGLVAAFALGSIGAFLVFHWPPLLREILFGYLIVFLAIRVTAVLGQFLLAPDNERFRVIPMPSQAARYWYLRLRLVVGWLVFGLVTRELLGVVGITPIGRDLVGYAFGLGTLAILMEALWRRPVASGVAPVAEAPSAEGGRESRHLSRIKVNVILTAALVLLWSLRVAAAMPAFWLLAVLILWPLADRLTRRAVEHLLRPPGTAEIVGLPTLTTVFLERGLRAALIIATLALLAWGWGIDLEMLAGRGTVTTRIAHGALSAVAIALIADFIWHVAKAAIDCKLAESADLSRPNTDEARRRARLRTLLPIFRNILFVVVIVVAAMMILAALGVEIGPLIAGLSVVGVAIGFGAQTFVRDIIAGMFYLVDDAFRIGEYIQSGNYKGTVEGFSIRSVKLRHQRGPIYTVPFGLLGAVENMSRDWVIDKLTVGITYDSDIDKARKLIKQIGLDLAQNPEYAPLILEPLKMQGVDAFGDYAVQIRMKMMTLPGENFVIRRQALAMIKKAFDANGIKFAYPTVQLAGDGDASAAAVAQQALTLTRSAAE